MEDSSDDSDICENSKNIQSTLVKSRVSQEEVDDYAYKRRLGDLIFDANFEGGNLGYVENIDRYEYDLMVRPDISNSNQRVWFNFKVSNQLSGQCVILTIVNLSEHLRLFHEGYCPVVRSRERPEWVSLDGEQVFYYKSQNHGNRFVLSIVMRFSTQDNEHQFALFYPYTYSTLCEFLDRWQVELMRLKMMRRAETMRHRQAHLKLTKFSRKSPEPLHRHWLVKNRDDDNQLRTRSSLETTRDRKLAGTINNYLIKGLYEPSFTIEKVAESSLSKSIHCVSIGPTVKSNAELISKEMSTQSSSFVIIICRVAGNMDGIVSFVCQGLIDYLLSDSLVAEAARESIEFRVFPMMDPDSICCGNSCTDLLGRQAPTELSTALIEANSVIYSNFTQVQSKIKGILEKIDKQRRAIVIELRANLELMGSRILGSNFDDLLRLERHLSVPKTMSKFIEDFYLETCKFPASANHEMPSSWLRVLTASMPDLDHYVFEVSPFGSYRRSLDERDYLKYDQVTYLKIGKALIYSFVDLLRPKHADHVTSILDKFQHHSHDIDDLTLNLANLN